MYLASAALVQCLFLLCAPTGAQPVVGHGVWPLQPRPQVVGSFDPPDSPWGAGHRGVDLAGRVGQTVRAAEGGTISFAGTLAGRGVVVVDHGELRSTYEPVTASVTTGDPVGPGQPIGALQLGLSHCFPTACLHWGLLRGETYLDPLLLLGLGPVRLLPVQNLFDAIGFRLWGGPVGMPFAAGLW